MADRHGTRRAPHGTPGSIPRPAPPSGIVLSHFAPPRNDGNFAYVVAVRSFDEPLGPDHPADTMQSFIVWAPDLRAAQRRWGHERLDEKPWSTAYVHRATPDEITVLPEHPDQDV